MEADEQEKQNEVSLRDILISLPVFDDLYLQMQALNIHIVDAYLVDIEHDLLNEYMETERTPLEKALVASALSQLWIFGLYELLRTWRQRANNIIKFVDGLQSLDNSARKSRISEQKERINKAVGLGGSAMFYWPAYEKAAREDDYVQLIQKKVDQSERLFRRIEALRISLAKHELPKVRDSFTVAPGYGRIDMTNGSIYWQVVLFDNEIDLVSRRSIANQCRELARDMSHAILPKHLQKKVEKFPKHGYADKIVKVILKDGTEYNNVMIVWCKEVVGVLGYGDIPFDANDVLDVHIIQPKNSI
jgi:hypothetical protein